MDIGKPTEVPFHEPDEQPVKGIPVEWPFPITHPLFVPKPKEEPVTIPVQNPEKKEG